MNNATDNKAARNRRFRFDPYLRLFEDTGEAA